MRNLIFFSLLALVLVIAWRRGRSDERLAAVICIVGTILTIIAGRAMQQRFGHFDVPMFLVDLAVLAAFTAIALRSQRYWPLWVAGLQLTGTVVHVLKLLHPQLMPFVTGVALAFWSYPILLVIVIGSLRTQIIDGWRSAQQLPQAG